MLHCRRASEVEFLGGMWTGKMGDVRGLRKWRKLRGLWLKKVHSYCTVFRPICSNVAKSVLTKCYFKHNREVVKCVYFWNSQQARYFGALWCARSKGNSYRLGKRFSEAA